jgi:hypothetical protein
MAFGTIYGKPKMWFGVTLVTEYPSQALLTGEYAMKLADLPTTSQEDAVGLGISGFRLKIYHLTIREIPFIQIEKATKLNAKISGMYYNIKPSKLRFIPYNLFGVEQTQGIIEIELNPSELANTSKDIEVQLNKLFNYKVVVEYKDSNDYYITSNEDVARQFEQYFIHDWSLS